MSRNHIPAAPVFIQGWIFYVAQSNVVEKYARLERSLERTVEISNKQEVELRKLRIRIIKDSV